MSPLNRITKNTLFAAAVALGISAAVSVNAAIVTTTETTDTGAIVTIEGTGTGTVNASYAAVPYTDLEGNTLYYATDYVINVSGDVSADIFSGGTLYNLHYNGYNSSSGLYAAYYRILRSSYTGSPAVIGGVTYTYEGYSLNSAQSVYLDGWSSGELRIESGTLELTGYVNTWFDFGEVLNEYYGADADGDMMGASRITITNDGVLDLSGNTTFSKNSTYGYMSSGSYSTIYQYLHNVQAGDLGLDANATIVLGDSERLLLNIYIDAWDASDRTQRSDGTYLDNTLAFGGSIGVLDGAADVYKTGEGDFTILNTSAGFTGSLYAAGGNLILAGTNTAGSTQTYTATDSDGNALWSAKINYTVSNAQSVNIAGDDATQGSLVAQTYWTYSVSYTSLGYADDGYYPEYYYYLIKEAYAPDPSAGTLVIAENQAITNFQSYFNGGYAVSSGTTAEAAVTAAQNISVSVSGTSYQVDADSIIATLPVITGTGSGSNLVILGGNYIKTGDGEWEVNTVTEGSVEYMQGGVLLITQEEGMGGVYTGTICGATVKIYDKVAFEEATEAEEDVSSSDTLSSRKEDAQITSLSEIVSAVGLTEDEAEAFAILFDEETGEISLGQTEALLEEDAATQKLALNAAWKVIEYYKSITTGDDSAYYLEYTASTDVQGGVLILDGAGDLALLLESSNYSGVTVASTRTGKTILNVAALNSLDGAEITALGDSDVYFVCTQDDTLTGKLVFGEDAGLVFTSAETISSVVVSDSSILEEDETAGGNTILVGDVRKAVTAFKYVQDEVYGSVYVERGITLDLSGNEDVFGNAAAIVIWEGDSATATTAAAAISLKNAYDSSDSTTSYNQVLNNLTGDSTARIYLGTGVLTANITSNDDDERSGLTLGTFAGIISGTGSVVKAGSETWTLSWSGTATAAGSSSFTGTLEVAEGELAVTGANGATSLASAVILNTGTTLTLTGNQTIRNLFGGADTSVTLTGGTLTLGADITAGNGENRPNVSNNLGTSDNAADGSFAYDNSFERFENNYDLEGNLLFDDEALTELKEGTLTQAEVTQVYLESTAKLAYSGFDTSILEDYADYLSVDVDDVAAVAGTDGSGSVEISFARYSVTTETTTDADGNETTTETVSVTTTVTVSRDTVLSDLVTLYSELETEKTFAENVTTDSDGVYDPESLLRSFFTTTKAYNAYIDGTFADMLSAAAEEAGVDLTSITSASELAKVNEVYKAVIIAAYQELTAEVAAADVAEAFDGATADAILEKFTSEFGEITNLGGTSLLGDEDDESSYTAQLNALLYDEDGELLDAEDIDTDAVVALYEEVSDAVTAIEVKSLFAGISITGAFANSVTTDGTLVTSEWLDELVYAGTITTPSLIKDGDNTVTLTGTLITSQILVESGTLIISLDTLDATNPDADDGENIADGISVSRGAALGVYVEEGEDVTLDYALSGSGNFVKSGDGALTLGEDVLYTGTTTIEGGTLTLTLRNTTTVDSATVLPQGDIYLAADDVTLILAQGDEIVSWASDITTSDGVTGVTVEKTGDIELEITGTVSLGDESTLIVSEGSLILSSLVLGSETEIYIASGASLDLEAVEISTETVEVAADEDSEEEASTVEVGVGSVALAGAGALRVTGTDVSLVGFEAAQDSAVKADGTGYTVETFTGTFTVESGASVTLSGDSIFSDTREVYVFGSLTIAESSTQKTLALSGSTSGTITIESGATLEITPNEERVVADYSSGVYTFDEDAYLNISDYQGTITGEGKLAVSGTGATRLTGIVETEVSITDGAQAVINASTFTGTVTVDGTPVVYYTDNDGNVIVGGYTKGATATAVYVESEEEIETAGFTVRSDGEGWDYSAEDEDDGVIKFVANWEIVDSAGAAIDLTALVYDEENDVYTLDGTTILELGAEDDDGVKTYVLASDDYSISYNWLAETDSGDYSLAVLTKSATVNTVVGELIFLVSSGTIILDSGTIEITNSGNIGKVGDGTLSVDGGDLDAAGTVTVYEGRLEVEGWFQPDKVIADDATLAITLEKDESPDFSTVKGSGTLEIDSQDDVTINSASADTNPLPPTDSTGSGEFFNGTISFVSSTTEYGVYLSGESASDPLEITTVSTDSGVSLTLSNVRFLQSQNSSFAGAVTVAGTVYVEGLTDDSGNVNSTDLRRLSVADATEFTILDSTTEFILKNVGFGFGDDQTGITVKIDSESVSNTFFIQVDDDKTVTTSSADTGAAYTTGSLVAEGTEISLDVALTGKATVALTSLSFVKTGEGTLTVDAATLAAIGSTDSDSDYDTVFGVEESVYEYLGENGGTFTIGVEDGELVLDLSDVGDDYDGTFTTVAGGVDVNFVTLRSTVETTSGTLVISVGVTEDDDDEADDETADTSTGTSNAGTIGISATTTDGTETEDSDTVSTIIFAETVSGTGNVLFEGSAEKLLVVTATQEYTGQTTISGYVEFSGDGRTSSSSLVTVTEDSVLYGGVVLTGRDVTGTVSAYRNMDDTGDAGTTTLTVSISDDRLGDTIRLRVTLDSDGNLLDSDGNVVYTSGYINAKGTKAASWDGAALGTWQGVEIESIAPSSDGTSLTITLYDEAIDESYSVTLSIGSIPSTAGSSSSTGTQTYTVAGNVAVESGATIVLDASAGDTIDVGTGTAAFEDGAMLYVSNLTTSLRGTPISLVSAGTITYGDDYESGHAVVAALRAANNAVDEDEMMNLLVYTDSSTGTITALILSDDFTTAASYNDGISGSFLSALSGLASESTSGTTVEDGILDLTDDDTVESSLLYVLNTLSGDGLAAEVERLSPSLYGAMLAMPVTVFNTDISRLRERLNQRRYDGASPLRETGEYEFFAFAQTEFADNGNGHSAATFDYNLYGITAGADWKPSFDTTYGLALGYTYGKATAHHSGGKLEMDDIRITAFGSKTLGKLYIDGGLQAGTTYFDAYRKSNAGSSRGDTTGFFAGAFATVGTVFTLSHDKKSGEGLYVTPSFGLSYMHLTADAFEESGLAGLDIDDIDGDSFRARLAVGLQWVVPFDIWTVRFGAELAYAHEFLADELDIDGCFTAGGSSFSTSPIALSSDTISFGPTMDVMLSEKSSVYAGYEIEFGTESGLSQGVNLGFRYRF